MTISEDVRRKKKKSPCHGVFLGWLRNMHSLGSGNVVCKSGLWHSMHVAYGGKGWRGRDKAVEGLVCHKRVSHPVLLCQFPAELCGVICHKMVSQFCPHKIWSPMLRNVSQCVLKAESSLNDTKHPKNRSSNIWFSRKAVGVVERTTPDHTPPDSNPDYFPPLWPWGCVLKFQNFSFLIFAIETIKSDIQNI